MVDSPPGITNPSTESSSERRRTLHAEAYQVLVCVSRSTFEKVPLPAEVVEAVEGFTMTCEEARG